MVHARSRNVLLVRISLSLSFFNSSKEILSYPILFVRRSLVFIRFDYFHLYIHPSIPILSVSNLSIHSPSVFHKSNPIYRTLELTILPFPFLPSFHFGKSRFKLLLSPRPPSSSSPSSSPSPASARPSEGPNGDEDDDSEELIRTKAFENGVLALPGTSFLATGGKTAYVRASFSLSGPEDVEEALRRLKVTILQERERMGVVGVV